MGTVSKALRLLELLREPGGPRGLTAIARSSGYDKTTARRLLSELMLNGFVEQEPESRDYHLGAALQILGHAREEQFPLYRTLLPAARELALATGETVHGAEFSPGALISICIEQSAHAIRVMLNEGQKLPLHATGSGLAFLAASSPAFVESVLRKPLQAFTRHTPTTRQALLQLVSEAATRGYSISNQSFEDSVHSVAAAIIGANDRPVGTIAVAMPTARATPALTERYGRLVRRAAQDVSAKLSGRSQVRNAS